MDNKILQKDNYRIELVKMFKTLNKEFAKINFEWFPFAGTLLGAVRYGGIIPWDDDIDMMAKHSDILEKIADIKSICIQLGLEIISYTDFFDKDIIRIYHPNNFSAVVDGKKIENRPFIEIHPMKSVIKGERYRYISVYGSMSSVTSVPIGKYKKRFPIKKTKNIWLRFFKSFGTVIIPKRKFRNKIEKRLDKEDKGDIYTTIYNSSLSNHFPFIISELKNLEFEGENLNAPSNYIEYLEDKFGNNYMEKETKHKNYFPHHLANWVDNRWEKK